MAKLKNSIVVLKNKKAKFNYEILEEECAGIKLLGTEIKSIRLSNASITEAYVFIDNDNNIWIKGMHISEYENRGYSNHEPYRDKQLLLTKKQISKFRKSIETKGLTIVPIKGFFTESGIFKIIIGLGKGKKIHDKRNTIKTRDLERNLNNE